MGLVLVKIENEIVRRVI